MWQVAQVGAAEVILADDPGFGIEIHLGEIGAVLNAMLRLVVDFDLRVIGSEVAFATVFGHAGGGRAEGVTAVTRGATALAAVGIDAANAAVGPGGGIEFSFAEIFHFAAVALAAAVICRRTTLDNFAEHVVQ